MKWSRYPHSCLPPPPTHTHVRYLPKPMTICIVNWVWAGKPVVRLAPVGPTYPTFPKVTSNWGWLQDMYFLPTNHTSSIHTFWGSSGSHPWNLSLQVDEAEAHRTTTAPITHVSCTYLQTPVRLTQRQPLLLMPPRRLNVCSRAWLEFPSWQAFTMVNKADNYLGNRGRHYQYFTWVIPPLKLSHCYLITSDLFGCTVAGSGRCAVDGQVAWWGLMALGGAPVRASAAVPLLHCVRCAL